VGQCREEGANLPPANRFAAAETVLFRVLLLLFTALCIWPIWSNRLLPMQDYPQHLFLAQLTSSYDNPVYNWKEFYTVDLGFRPYMLWYLAMQLLSGFGAESAGKILFTVYILLITLLVLALRRVAAAGSQPWGALLLFPFAFSQMYYMGFANYLISLPLLFLAVLDFDTFGQALPPRRAALHGLLLVLLILNHPYTTLVYIALAATSAYSYRHDRRHRRRLLKTAAMLSIIFSLWYLIGHSASSAPTASPWSVLWWQIPEVVRYYLLMFTGMLWHGGPDWRTVGLWGVVACIFFGAWRRGFRSDLCSIHFLRLYAACVAGQLLLPYWMGYYSFFNLRLAPVSYFALSLLLSRLRLPLRDAALLGASVFALLLISVQAQKSLAREAETVLPALSAAQKNALVLPLLYSTYPKAIDSGFFYQNHAHEADYYHIVAGGGGNPTLFPNAMMPVQYRPGLRLPYPLRPEDFRWQVHGAYYDYVITREAPAETCRSLSLTCDLVSESGPWKLFRNRIGRKSL
jgi:hypothetical protein